MEFEGGLNSFQSKFHSPFSSIDPSASKFHLLGERKSNIPFIAFGDSFLLGKKLKSLQAIKPNKRIKQILRNMGFAIYLYKTLLPKIASNNKFGEVVL